MKIGIIIVSVLVLLVVLFALFYLKRLLVFTSIFTLLFYTLIIISYVDQSYYEGLMDGVSNDLNYLFVFALLLLLFSISEMLILCLILLNRKKKVKERLMLDLPKMENTDQILAFINVFQIAIAYYSFSKEAYIINLEFKDRLKISSNYITKDEFSRYIIDKDRDDFLKMNFDRYKFCMYIEGRYYYFEESISMQGEQTYIIIYPSGLNMNVYEFTNRIMRINKNN